MLYYIMGKFGSEKFGSEKFGSLLFWLSNNKIWQINRSVESLVIISTNLDVFILASYWQFTKSSLHQASPLYSNNYYDTVPWCMLKLILAYIYNCYNLQLTIFLVYWKFEKLAITILLDAGGYYSYYIANRIYTKIYHQEIPLLGSSLLQCTFIILIILCYSQYSVLEI